MRWWRSLATLSDAAWRRSFWVIVAVALLARVALILATPHFVPFGDPADYERNAASIATGHGMGVSLIASPGTPSALRPPAYPFLLGGVYAVFGIHLWLGRLLSALLGTLVVPLLMLLGRRLWDRRIALVSGAIAAVYLPLIALNATLLSESLFVPLELAVALAMAGLVRAPTWRRAALVGVLIGLAALTRTVGLLWLIPALVVIARGPAPRRARATTAAAAVLALVVVLTPWTVRNAEAFHAFVPISTQDGFTLAGEYNRDAGSDDALRAVWRVPIDVASIQPILHRLAARNHGAYNEAQLDSALRSEAIGYLGRHPSQLLIAAWLGSLRMFDLGVAHTFTTNIAYREMNLPTSLWRWTTLTAQLFGLLAMLGLGALATRRFRFDARPLWLWSLPLLATAVTVVSAATPRYRVPADPFMILFAVVAAAALIERRVGA